MWANVLGRIINISTTEFSRTFYSWILKLVFFTGAIIGWTVVTATVVARLNISFLPYLILFQALFTMGGMFLFSVVVEKTDVKKLIIASTVFSIFALLLAALYYENNFLFILFSLIANGVFLSQVVIFLSNYIEEHFTPTEAQRTFPVIESSETIGGILGGAFLAIFGLHLLSRDIFLVWTGLLILFLVLMLVFKPAVPFSLEKLHKSGHKSRRNSVFNINSIEKSIAQIKKVPFLQLLAVVLVLNWIISIFIEFNFTKAVDDSLGLHHANEADHEKLLTHGLGTLHIIIHGSALLFEMLAANRIILKLGAFGSFLLHAFLTAASVVANVFAKGFFTSVLLKHNFVISGIVQKSAYENTYYAYGEDMQKAMREFFEGIAYPLSCVVGTLMIIGMQFLLLEEHFYYFIQLVIIFLIAGMVYFTYQMKSRYTTLNLENLKSSDKLTCLRAVNILVQKGHRKTIEVLTEKYCKCNDLDIRKTIALKLSMIPARRSVQALVKMYDCATGRDKPHIIKAMTNLLQTIIRKPALKGDVLRVLKKRLRDKVAMVERARILAVLLILSGKKVSESTTEENALIRALAIREMWNLPGQRDTAKAQIDGIIANTDTRGKWILVFLAGKLRYRPLKKYFLSNTENHDSELQAVCLMGAVCLHRYEFAPKLGKILLFGNESLFKKCLDVLDFMPIRMKSHITGALLPHGFVHDMPDTKHGRCLSARLNQLFEVCETGDEYDYLQYNVDRLIPIFKKS